MQDWNYRHHITGGGKCGTGIIGTKLQGVENAGPRGYGTPKHLVVAAHKKSSVQLFVESTNAVTVSFNTMTVLVTVLILMLMRCA